MFATETIEEAGCTPNVESDSAAQRQSRSRPDSQGIVRGERERKRTLSLSFVAPTYARSVDKDDNFVYDP